MKTQYLKAKVLVKAEGEKITVVASDETLDRHGEVLPIEAWDLSKFKQAPRMLVDHDHRVEKITGKWSNIRVEGKQLLMDAIFHDITQLAKEVRDMVVQAFLDTVSVGFIFHESAGDGQRPVFELIEVSWVTVPANPNARIQHSFKSALEKVTTPEEKQKIKEFGEIEDSDEVLPDGEDEAVEEEEEGDEPEPMDDVEEDEKVFSSAEAMEKAGFKIISTKEDLEEWKFINREKGVSFAGCDILFLEKLIERS